MTKLTLPFLLIALAASAPAAPVPDEAKAPVLFFPTTPVTWVYECWGVRWTTPSEVTEVIVSVKGVNGEKVVALGSVYGGKAQPSNSMVTVSERGLVEGFGGFNQRFETVATALRWPIAPGETWVGKLPPVGHKERRLVTRGWEKVRVPAGQFDAVRVDSTYVLQNGTKDRVDRTWYSPGVGVVKWEEDEGRMKVLKRFVMGMSWEVAPPPGEAPQEVGAGR
ncbi:hypothetical protein J0H58_04835 [bacterium]|nr:hypothetical protein [bacterium]